MIVASNIPKVIWIHTILIMTMGLLALYSASYNNDVVSVSVFYDQLFCAGVGILLMLFLAHGDYRKFFDVAYIVYGISVVFLILVLIMGRHALGATRWFSLGGFSGCWFGLVLHHFTRMGKRGFSKNLILPIDGNDVVFEHQRQQVIDIF